MSKPILHGIKVLDLSHMYPGTLCTWLLAALGAEILKVEEPGAVRSGAPFLNQGKKSIALNLKSDGGREVLYRLAKESDIVLEGFRPGVARRLRVNYETLRELNSRLVYCSISSFGQTGPSVSYSAHDINFLALSGMLGIGREAGRRPLPPAAQVADVAGGGYPALSAILAAYIAVLRDGEGRYIDISMFDWTLLMVARYLMLEPPPRRSRPVVKREHATWRAPRPATTPTRPRTAGSCRWRPWGPRNGLSCARLWDWNGTWTRSWTRSGRPGSRRPCAASSRPGPATTG